MRSENHGALMEERLSRFTIDMVPDPVFVFQVEEGPRFRCVAANSAGLTATRFGEDAVVGRVLEEIVAPEEAALSVERFAAAMEVDAPIRSERTIDLPVGRLSFQITTAAIHDEGGSCTHIVTLSRDVTDLREAQRLREAEERFRTAFDHAPIGIALVKPDGRFLQVNWAMCEMLGYTEEQLAALTWMDITHPDDLETSRQAASELVAGATESIALEKRYLRADGQIVWGRLRASVVRDSEGSPLYLIGQLVDVTDLKHSYQRLEELVRSKDEFVASVSHELRTPLTAVLGFAELLQNEEPGLSATDRDEMIQSIAHQAFELSSIVEDLLVAARAEMGTMSIAAVPIDLRAQTAQVIETYEQEAASRIKVDGESVQALGDPIRVRQILRNLLSNAMRYGGDDIRVQLLNGNGSARALVSDNGPGIRAEDKDLIFEPYYRASKGPGVSGSVGLGLTVSRKLARLMSGELTFQRNEGWSIFQLSLPAGPTDQGDDAPTEARASVV